MTCVSLKAAYIRITLWSELVELCSELGSGSCGADSLLLGCDAGSGGQAGSLIGQVSRRRRRIDQ